MDYNIEDTIGLVINQPCSMAKCISVLRKYNPLSISDYKSAIESGEYVFYCDYTDDSGLRKLRRCYDELKKEGLNVEIYEQGDLTTREFISNLLRTYHEIELETQTMMDIEAEEENE